MKAYLDQFPQPPRKVRLLATLVRGKTVAKAIIALRYADQKPAVAMSKLISSAAANSNLSKEAQAALIVKDIRVDEALKQRRFMPRAMGRAAKFHKNTSHISVVLSEGVEKTKTKKQTKQRVAKAAATN
jgi:large subunit ribosomal protein L22